MICTWLWEIVAEVLDVRQLRKVGKNFNYCQELVNGIRSDGSSGFTTEDVKRKPAQAEYDGWIVKTDQSPPTSK